MNNRSTCLTVAHNIFLTQEERYALIETGNVQTIGISVPVWLKRTGRTDEPAEEVFCEYEIIASNHYSLIITQRGYIVFIQNADRLKDIAEPVGSEAVMFTNHCHELFGEEVTDVLHFVSIQDVKMLMKSMC